MLNEWRGRGMKRTRKVQLARLHILLVHSAALFLMIGFSAPAQAADAALGEYLSSQCTTCHQLSGKASGIPSIVGWDQESFIAVMQSYKKKERDNKVMQNIAGTLSTEDTAALAAYFATIQPKED